MMYLIVKIVANNLNLFNLLNFKVCIMQLYLEFDNNGNTFNFDYLSNTQNILESNYLQISIDVMDLIFKKHRENFNCLKRLEDNTVLIDKITKSRYIITSHTLKFEKLSYVFSFSLVPEVELKSAYSKVNTYNDCTFIDNSININNFESYYNQMSYNDAKLLQELIELMVYGKVLEKSKLQKFKDMLINNTDVLGILVPIILKIIGM
jgi:hypothetical protein